MADRASATESTTAPAIVTGAMAPASVNGATTTACPRRTHRKHPSIIGWSCFSGEVELILVYMRGVAWNSSSESPPASFTSSITSSIRSLPSE